MDESLKRQIHEECRIRNRSEGTCKQYTFHIGKFLDWIVDKPLNELTLYDAREYIIKKRNDGVKPESCNGINSALVFFYRYILHITWDLDIVPRMKRDWTLPQVVSRDDIEKSTLLPTYETKLSLLLRIPPVSESVFLMIRRPPISTCHPCRSMSGIPRIMAIIGLFCPKEH